MRRTYIATLSLLSLWPSTGLAQPRDDAAFSLEYVVPAGDGCPTEADLRARLASQLGEDRVRADAPRVVRVEVVRERALRRGTLSLRGPGAAPLTRTFAPARVSCRDLVESVALSLGITLQELASSDGPRSAEPARTEPPPTSAPARVEDILVPVVPPSERVTSIAPTPPEAPPPPPRAHGLELSLRAGVGSFTVTDDSAWLGRDLSASSAPSNEEVFSASFALDARIGWRFSPHFSVGMRGAMQLLGSERSSASMSAWTLGADLRWYMFPGVGRGDIEPWFSVGIDALAIFEASTTLTSASALSSEFTHRAVALPMALGVDVHVAPRFAVGVSGMLSWWIHYETCARGTFSTLAQDLCSQGSHFTLSSGASATSTYALRDDTQWSIALDARYTLDL